MTQRETRIVELQQDRRHARAANDHEAYRAATAEMESLGATGSEAVEIERRERRGGWA